MSIKDYCRMLTPMQVFMIVVFCRLARQEGTQRCLHICKAAVICTKTIGKDSLLQKLIGDFGSLASVQLECTCSEADQVLDLLYH